MGFGKIALDIVAKLKIEAKLDGLEKVVEIGAQTFTVFPAELFDFLDAHTILYDKAKIRDLIVKDHFLCRDFYRLIGFKEYCAVDLNGEYGSHQFDLNRNLRDGYGFDDTFDFVTNLGTTEHVFNQHVVFENIHNLCQKDGYMLHTVPIQGYFDHGLFNYHPNFFIKLAKANNYAVEGIWVNPDSSLDMLVDYKYENLNYIKSLSGGNSHVLIAVLYKKLTDENFKIPFQLMVERDSSKNYRALQKSLRSLFGYSSIEKIAIFGAADTGGAVQQLCNLAGIEVACFVDDLKEGEIEGVPVVNRADFIARFLSDVECLVIATHQAISIDDEIKKKIPFVSFEQLL